MNGMNDWIDWGDMARGHQRDPDYDYVPPIRQSQRKKGIQCGECGVKFEYGQSYGFCCMQQNCPTSFGRS